MDSRFFSQCNQSENRWCVNDDEVDHDHNFVYQEGELDDNLWSLVREDIIEIKDDIHAPASSNFTWLPPEFPRLLVGVHGFGNKATITRPARAKKSTQHETGHQQSPLQEFIYEGGDDESDGAQSVASLPCTGTSTTISHRNNEVVPDLTDRWMARFQDLLEYREKYGHCIVSYTFKEKPLLYSWVKRQRYQYKCLLQGKASQLTTERVQLLESVDFAWDTHDIAWETNYALLKEFVKFHGNCHIPVKERRMFAWAKRQRYQHKRWIAKQDSTMTEDRHHRLSMLGFRWSNTENELHGSHGVVKSPESRLP